MILSSNDIRQQFAELLKRKQFTTVTREESLTKLVGNRTIEILGASFLAEHETLFGKLDHDYIAREEQWYDSQSRNVNDIQDGAPTIWKAIASKDGTINSNYGWCCYSRENGSQFFKVITELKKNPESRRAIIIYTRPSMWDDYNVDGRSDFMCTNTVQYMIRDGFVHALVQMRSNDAVFGYKNDRAWQMTMLKRVSQALHIPVGKLYWSVGSIHVYERHFYLVDHFSKVSETSISKKIYCELYPDSEYVK